ncbi:hypothetical protein [Sphingomonas folli]|nr:hypothetical protein [Sphingomonas folli]
MDDRDPAEAPPSDVRETRADPDGAPAAVPLEHTPDVQEAEAHPS